LYNVGTPIASFRGSIARPARTPVVTGQVVAA
jgi:hypothetical protein